MPRETPVLGRRIVVWGVTGSGKTTLATQLGTLLGLPVVELDAIRHRNGWDSTDWSEFRTELTQRLDGYSEGWVLEGSYSQIMDVYLKRADTLVWLHMPFLTSFSRLLRRTVARAWDHKPLYHSEGPRESWRLSFLSRNSILWYALKSHRSATRHRIERVAELPSSIRAYELRSPQEVEVFLKTAKRHNSAANSSSLRPD